MEETNLNQYQIQKPQEGISTLTGILIALLAAVIAGAGVWAYYTYKVIPDLEKEPTTTVYSKPATPTSTSTSTTATTDETSLKIEICKELYPNNTYGIKQTSIGKEYCQVDKISSNFARGAIGKVVDSSGGGPGAAWLAKLANNKWIVIQTTQDMWDCTILRQNNVPKDILSSTNNKCYNYSTQKEETY